MIFGYVRGISETQSLERQIEELRSFGCDFIFEEKQTDLTCDKPVYKEMRSKLCSGDILVVYDLSGLGKKFREIRDEWKALIEENIEIIVLKMPILDTRKEGGERTVADLVLSLLSWVVEEEGERVRIAQKKGIEIAKRQGKFMGGKRRYHENATGEEKIIYDEVVRCLKDNISIMNIHRNTGLSRNTIYIIKEEIEKLK
ncbi:recombinase family protein [Sporosarcina sp. FSL W7-1283]|uniref:recombinase family protein n=1 Tax=Sporosarcina sp. FSL W7-1283 TaxID=2921560 RepID=UPI004046F774